MASPLLATRAYAAAQQTLNLGAPTQSGGAAGPSFQQLLQGAITDAVSASKTSEQMMAAHAAGKAELVDVVTAVSSAETSLETVMAVRDQVIQAYQEIMRMPI